MRAFLRIRHAGLLLGAIAGALLWFDGRARSNDAAAGEVGPSDGTALSSIWTSPEACRAALARGERAPRTAGTLRLGTWNVRYFPDGGSGNRPRSGARGPKATHVEWLACAIAWLDLDVLALQEIKSPNRSESAVARLSSELNRLTGRRYTFERDRCPGKGRQHVALLFDEGRLTGSGFRNYASFNPHGGACDHQLRPGFGGYFKSAGHGGSGGGRDFHFASVHFDSGQKRRELDARRRSFEGLAAAYRDAQAFAPDPDVLIAGDFNTMGCAQCSPKVGAEEELSRTDALLGGLGFQRVPALPACSEYYRGAPALLDFLVLARAPGGVPSPPPARVHGYCAEARCGRISGRQMPRAYEELSDHCPLVVEVEDRDRD